MAEEASIRIDNEKIIDKAVHSVPRRWSVRPLLVCPSFSVPRRWSVRPSSVCAWSSRDVARQAAPVADTTEDAETSKTSLEDETATPLESQPPDRGESLAAAPRGVVETSRLHAGCADEHVETNIENETPQELEPEPADRGESLTAAPSGAVGTSRGSAGRVDDNLEPEPADPGESPTAATSGAVGTSRTTTWSQSPQIPANPRPRPPAAR